MSNVGYLCQEARRVAAGARGRAVLALASRAPCARSCRPAPSGPAASARTRPRRRPRSRRPRPRRPGLRPASGSRGARGRGHAWPAPSPRPAPWPPTSRSCSAPRSSDGSPRCRWTWAAWSSAARWSRHIDPKDYQYRLDQAVAGLKQARVRLGLPPEGDDDRVDAEQTAVVRQARALLDQALLTRDRMARLWEQQLVARRRARHRGLGAPGRRGPLPGRARGGPESPGRAAAASLGGRAGAPAARRHRDRLPDRRRGGRAPGLGRRVPRRRGAGGDPGPACTPCGSGSRCPSATPSACGGGSPSA